jgi:hypothetical protein
MFLLLLQAGKGRSFGYMERWPVLPCGLETPGPMLSGRQLLPSHLLSQALFPDTIKETFNYDPLLSTNLSKKIRELPVTGGVFCGVV